MITLNVTVEYHGVKPMSAEQKKESLELLTMFEKREKEKRDSAKAQNELETYIINSRKALSEDDDVIAVCSSALSRSAELSTCKVYAPFPPRIQSSFTATKSRALSGMLRGVIVTSAMLTDLR
jgi:hypothetical protein